MLFLPQAGTEQRATFALSLPVLGVAELLALADEAMNRLRSTTGSIARRGTPPAAP